MIFPGGSTLISMPHSRTLFGSVSSSSPCPPPNSSVKICLKFLLIFSKLSTNISFIVSVSSLMSVSSSFLLFVTSLIWCFKNSYLSETSAYSSIAPRFTLPRAFILALSSASSLFAWGIFSTGSQSFSASERVSSWSSQSLAASLSKSTSPDFMRSSSLLSSFESFSFSSSLTFSSWRRSVALLSSSRCSLLADSISFFRSWTVFEDSVTFTRTFSISFFFSSIL